MSTTPTDSFDLEEYRSYLRFLADIQLDPKLRARTDASDIVQVTLLNAHQGLEDFRGTTDQQRRAWLKKILERTLINVAKEHKRKKRDPAKEISIDQQLQKSAMRIMGEPASDQSSPSQQLMQRERAEQLAVAMSRLLDDEYSAVLLKHIHGWKVAEIAEHLGRSPEAVAGLLRRGLRKLRTLMQEPSIND